MGGGSIVGGLFIGILFSKLLLAMVLRIVQVDVPFTFSISVWALIVTLILFVSVYFIALVYNLGHVHLSNPITLLRSQSAGEKEPKTKWILATVSTLLLAGGYIIALSVKDPLSALVLFFVAVVLVIAGTYGVMTTGSIVFLKMLRKNKKYYYKTNHFISVSSMMYRMKQNAVGLASICILSTMVLVMLSTTTSLYMGMNDATNDACPRSIQVQATDITKNNIGKIDGAVSKFISDESLQPKQVLKFGYLECYMEATGTNFEAKSLGAVNKNINARVLFITAQDYNERVGSNIALRPGEALLYTRDVTYSGKKATFAGISYNFVKGEGEPGLDVPNEAYNGVPLYFVIVPDDAAIGKMSDAISKGLNQSDGQQEVGLSYYYGFNVSQKNQDLVDLTSKLDQAVGQLTVNGGAWASATSVASFTNEMLTLYGGLFFVGIFLGIMFTLATILIMYYKQISEGYDDRNRFEIMQKVGMEKSMIKGAIKSQVLTVFFLPLVVACIHICFAFNMISKMLSVLYMPNWQLFAMTTAGTLLVFGIIYTLAYSLTAKAYYRIVQ
jgi:putative ABC transport system permease protein